MGELIPNNIHFIWISSPDYGVPKFGFWEWVAIRSAIKANPMWNITVWTDHRITGKYWNAIKSLVRSRPIATPDMVFGNPIPHPAHKCDWLRIKVLQDHGGVYLDLDTITVKTFDGWLDESPGTMIVETANGSTVGLCNAVIAAEKNAPFLSRWAEKFRNFRSKGRDQFWNESAVLWPHQTFLEKLDFHTLSPWAFFLPDWTEQGIKAMFDEVHEYPQAIGHHLWSVVTRDRLNNIDETNYLDKDCSLSRIIHKALDDEIRSELVQA